MAKRTEPRGVSRRGELPTNLTVLRVVLDQLRQSLGISTEVEVSRRLALGADDGGQLEDVTGVLEDGLVRELAHADEV